MLLNKTTTKEGGEVKVTVRNLPAPDFFQKQ